MRLPLLSRRRGRDRSRGQSLVEFALVLPVLLLLTLVAIDFGRVFLGWVNLQQMTRVAAGFASEHASTVNTPGHPDQTAYQVRVTNDARAINCDLPTPLPVPVIGAGTALGAPVTVSLTCQFSVITPIISNIVGGTILVSAETTYPIREGAVAVVPGGGVPIVQPPDADFIATPQSGWSPLPVTFTDISLGGPSSWTWDFSVGAITGDGDGDVNQDTALSKGPHTITYECLGDPGDTCTFGVSLAVGNGGGTDTNTKANFITVTVPPDTGPIAEFTATPASGVEPLNVRFDFVDVRPPGEVNYISWQWDFTNDGTFDTNGQTVTNTYSTDGAYTVRLRVTDDTGATNDVIKVGAVVVTNRVCVVPDFANVRRNNAQSRWANAGFTTNVAFLSGSGNYQINYQSIVGGTIDPQPDGCASSITVGP
jgi:PKD repeat protein